MRRTQYTGNRILGTLYCEGDWPKLLGDETTHRYRGKIDEKREEMSRRPPSETSNLEAAQCSRLIKGEVMCGEHAVEDTNSSLHRRAVPAFNACTDRIVCEVVQFLQQTDSARCKCNWSHHR